MNKAHGRDTQTCSSKSVVKTLWEDPKALCFGPSELEADDDLRCGNSDSHFPDRSAVGWPAPGPHQGAARCCKHSEPAFPWTHAHCPGRGACELSGKLNRVQDRVQCLSSGDPPSPVPVPAQHYTARHAGPWCSGFLKRSGSETARKSTDGKKGDMIGKGYPRGF